MPQPYLVPVRPAFSRIAHNSGVSASTSTSKALPLIVRFAIACPLISSIHRSNFGGKLDWKLESFKSRFCVCREGNNWFAPALRRTRDFLLSFRPGRDHLGLGCNAAMTIMNGTGPLGG